MGSPQMNFIDVTLVKQGDGYAVRFGDYTLPIPADKIPNAVADLASYDGKEIVLGIRPEHVHDEP